MSRYVRTSTLDVIPRAHMTIVKVVKVWDASHQLPQGYLHQSSIYPVFYPAFIPVSLLLKNTTVWLAPDFGWPKLHCSRVKDAKAGRAGLVFFFFRMVVEIIDFLRPE